MVLLHNIVQVRTGATATTTAKFALLLQFCNDFGVGGVAVDVDHPRARVTGSTQRIPEEALGGSGITPGCQQEIDRGTGGIHSAVQVCPLALRPNVRLVHSPGTVGGLQFRTATLIQFRRIALDPTPARASCP